MLRRNSNTFTLSLPLLSLPVNDSGLHTQTWMPLRYFACCVLTAEHAHCTATVAVGVLQELEVTHQCPLMSLVRVPGVYVDWSQG